MVTFILHLVGGGKTEGIDIELGKFFTHARRSGLWEKAKAATKSAISKRRNIIPWKVFENIHKDAVRIALELWPENPDHTWKGFSVFAIDGSKFKLPATEKLREEFDPNSGLEINGKGHYPQCLVSTLYDVFRWIPIARTISPLATGEREEAAKLLSSIPHSKKAVVIYDRGYPSYDFIRLHEDEFDGHFLIRNPASSTFAAVQEFMKSNEQDSIIKIQPPSNIPKSKRKELPLLEVRVVKMCDPKGGETVLISNFLDQKNYSRKDLIELYYKRWKVEEYYRVEKIVLDVERFHSRTQNGIFQELYAAMIMTVISRVMGVLSEKIHEFDSRTKVQSKNAMIALAYEAAILVPDDPESAVRLFVELLDEMARVKYYPPKIPRPSQPRISKQSRNKWIFERKYNPKMFESS
jgi:hypothetical protein